MFYFYCSYQDFLLVALINESLHSQQETVGLTPPLSYNIFYGKVVVQAQVSNFIRDNWLSNTEEEDEHDGRTILWRKLRFLLIKYLHNYWCKKIYWCHFSLCFLFVLYIQFIFFSWLVKIVWDIFSVCLFVFTSMFFSFICLEYIYFIIYYVSHYSWNLTMYI